MFSCWISSDTDDHDRAEPPTPETRLPASAAVIIRICRRVSHCRRIYVEATQILCKLADLVAMQLLPVGQIRERASNGHILVPNNRNVPVV
jgi:hypothetical protein